VRAALYKLQLREFQASLRAAVEGDADELARLRAGARPAYQQARFC
jgi:hypothetical protein